MTHDPAVTGSVANNTAKFKIRRTNLAGAILANDMNFQMSAVAGTETYCETRSLIKNNSGADISSAICLTVLASAGTVTSLGAADRLRLVEVRDLGRSVTDYPSAIQI
jgi:hypothetical protein